MPDYTVSIKDNDITNSYTPGKTSVTVSKHWSDSNNQDGIRPQDISVQLYADGKESGKPVTLNEGNKWQYIWKELDEKKNGKTNNNKPNLPSTGEDYSMSPILYGAGILLMSMGAFYTRRKH